MSFPPTQPRSMCRCGVIETPGSTLARPRGESVRWRPDGTGRDRGASLDLAAEPEERQRVPRGEHRIGGEAGEPPERAAARTFLEDDHASRPARLHRDAH